MLKNSQKLAKCPLTYLISSQRHMPEARKDESKNDVILTFDNNEERYG